MNFHHGSVHRHVGKGGLITGFNEHIYYHLEAGGLNLVNEYDANYCIYKSLKQLIIQCSA